MSGTSLDGLDIAFCHFGCVDGVWQFEVIAANTFEYEEAWKKRLQEVTQLSGEALTQTHQELGEWMGKAVRRFMKKHEVDPELIASHGHTVFHQPEKGFTLQIGSSYAMHAQIGKPVISNFRDMDLALGGQGAPLVPIGDRLLFPQHDFCLNIGGIANVSAEVNGKRLAYDISPANMILNHFAQKLGHAYDKGGELARAGKVNKAILKKLNELAYYKAPYPKSLGYEWVLENVIQPIENENIATEDMLATLTHHIAQQIAANVHLLMDARQDAQPQKPAHEVSLMASGGGAFNDYLIECIRKYSEERFTVVLPNELIISFKEALIFAFLGVLRMRNEINCLSSVTGASHDHSAGTIYGNIQV
ncbi:anhydro-N-acetylmuramic acid kinase [Catalinimonas alkaloidigena]|uniref:anhydro-N-acetylmuramic acid kinase n=1 Tax=Catalinimonas alkaloidigena TaxID=1075417 RepID=UPI002407598F|nr:anhydro-N-acetylmuramic acid kinase [Catalinimonas alkaloidigena]MDF9800131.1 anhydro-N-acetylmuramic acid kinase [Catalinimonas alkaloidigena]